MSFIPWFSGNQKGKAAVGKLRKAENAGKKERRKSDFRRDPKGDKAACLREGSKPVFFSEGKEREDSPWGKKKKVYFRKERGEKNARIS